MMNDEREDKAAALAQYANASGQRLQPEPRGHAISRAMPNAMIADDEGPQMVGARAVEVKRDEFVILKKISALAAAAGPDWFYRYPVRSGDGQDWIEGPSIKLANAVASTYMNNDIDIREVDIGDAWVFYARFTDWENGTRLTRAFRQRKGQRSLKTRDSDRQLDIAYQVGQSKAIRNVVINALSVYTDFAFAEARASMVEKIGKDLAGWRSRTIERLKALPVEIHRVERVIGRPVNDWLAPDIARIVAMGKAIVDGMTTVDEAFPPAEAAPQAAVPADVADGVAALEAARKLGEAAKASGHTRKAVPGEYRDGNHEAELAAWFAGFDGA